MQAQIPAPPSEAGLQELHLHPSDDTVAEYAAGSTYGPGMVIEVTDQKNNPVPGAAVTFRFPDTGASGSFADGSHVGVAYTDAAGHAAFRNIRWNTMPGTLLVRVTAVGEATALSAGFSVATLLEGASATGGANASGKATVTVVPSPTLLCTFISP